MRAEDARRAAEAEARGFLADWDTAAARVTRYERSILPLARERVGACARGLPRRARHAHKRPGSAARRDRGADEPRAARLPSAHGPGPRSTTCCSRRASREPRTLCRARHRRCSDSAAAAGYWFGMSHPQAPSPGAPAAEGTVSARCSTGTTRWCRPSASTSPASHPSWTCSWCRVCRRRRRRAGGVQLSPRGAAGAGPAPGDGRDAARSVRPSRPWARCSSTSATSASCRRAPTASSSGSMRARRATWCAAGAPLVDVLDPEWPGAQQEYLAVKRHGDGELIAGARARLTLLGMPAAGRARRSCRARRCRCTPSARRPAASSPS